MAMYAGKKKRIESIQPTVEYFHHSRIYLGGGECVSHTSCHADTPTFTVIEWDYIDLQALFPTLLLFFVLVLPFLASKQTARRPRGTLTHPHLQLYLNNDTD
jgi:hypothetical protein